MKESRRSPNRSLPGLVIALIATAYACGDADPPAPSAATPAPPDAQLIMREVNRVYNSPELVQRTLTHASTTVVEPEGEPATEVTSRARSYYDSGKRRMELTQTGPGGSSDFGFVWTFQNDLFKLRERDGDDVRELRIDLSDLPDRDRDFLRQELPEIVFQASPVAHASFFEGQPTWLVEAGPITSEIGTSTWRLHFLQGSSFLVQAEIESSYLSTETGKQVRVSGRTTIGTHVGGLDDTSPPPGLERLLKDGDELFDLAVDENAETIPLEEFERYLASLEPGAAP